MTGCLWSVTAAFANGAEVLNCAVVGNEEEREDIGRDLAWLFELGHVVSYSVQYAKEPITAREWRQRTTVRIGSLVMDAIKGRMLVRPASQPGFLMPVWPFHDLNEHGFLATTARLLNTETELWAVPSYDDEAGFSVPGREGLYLPMMMPFARWRASSVI